MIVNQTNIVILQAKQQQQQQNRRGRGSRNTSNAPRDGVKKVHIPPFRIHEVELEN